MLKDILLTNNLNKKFKLEDLVGDKGLIIYFYRGPGNNPEGGCSIETKKFNDNFEFFKNKKFNIIGVSFHNEEKSKMIESLYKLNFLMLNDEDKQLSDFFGILNLEDIKNPLIRSTFILDQDLNFIKEFKNINPFTHVDDVIKEIKSFK